MAVEMGKKLFTKTHRVWDKTPEMIVFNCYFAGLTSQLLKENIITISTFEAMPTSIKFNMLNMCSVHGTQKMLLYFQPKFCLVHLFLKKQTCSYH